MSKALVIGSINRDVVAYVRHHASPGETVLAERGAYFPGGKGANQAIAIARLGGDVAFFGRIGEDAFGREMQSYLAAEEVDTAGIKVAKGAITGVALISVDVTGQNAITVISGANSDWEDAPLLLNAGAGDLVVAQLEIPLPVVSRAFAEARRLGARTVLNAAPFQPLDDGLLALTDMLIVNETELAALAGVDTSIDPGDMARLSRHVTDLAARGPSLIAVTLGAHGVFVQASGVTAVCVPGRRVDVRDTTGAGDCFVGAFVAELLRNKPPAEAAVFANAAAAVSVTREGAATSLPRRGEVMRFLDAAGVSL